MFSIYSHHSPFSRDMDYVNATLVPSSHCQQGDFLSVDPHFDYPLSPRSTSPLSQSSSILGSSYNSNTSTLVAAQSKKVNYRQLSVKLEQDPRLYCSIMHQVLPNFITVAVDPAGNYLCQSLIEHATTEQLGAMLAKMTTSWLSIVNHPHGTRVAQKMAEHIKFQSHYSHFVDNCMTWLTEMMKHNNGNHVLRKVVQHFPFHHSNCIYQAFLDNLDNYARDKYGVCVIQNALDVTTEQVRVVFYQYLKPKVLEMITDKFANYLVQYILDKASPSMVEECILCFLPQLNVLCRDQCASNVIEKAIKYASPYIRVKMINELSTKAGDLAMDPFGNYVLQTALEYSDKRTFTIMSTFLIQHENDLRMTPFVVIIHIGKKCLE